MIQKDFAEYAASLHEAALPPEIVHGAKRVVIDWFAATVPGGAVAPATLLIKALQKEGIGQGSAVLVPSGKRASLRTAALINGTAAHTVEFDDIYRFAIYHPGVVVIPAALAAAQTEHASGDRFLRAVIAGYEVSNRIGRTVNPAHYKYWHTTGTVGHFGAAVATAVVLGLDAGQIAHALATAGTMAAALQQAFRADAMTKPMHAGQAASNGALAAMAAGAGVTGAPSMFEGEVGFGAAMSDNPDWSAALADLGSHWTILDMTQKNHACCGFIHAAIDALINLRLEHGLEADNVARIRVGTYGTALEVARTRRRCMNASSASPIAPPSHCSRGASEWTPSPTNGSTIRACARSWAGSRCTSMPKPTPRSPVSAGPWSRSKPPRASATANGAAPARVTPTIP